MDNNDIITKEYIDKNSIYSKSKEIVEEIINDISDRHGLGNEWDFLDKDIKQEIRNIWEEIIINKLK